MIMDKVNEQEITINIFLAKNLKNQVSAIELALKSWGINSAHIIAVDKSARGDTNLNSLNRKCYKDESRFYVTVTPVLQKGLIIVDDMASPIFRTIGSRNEQMAQATFKDETLTLQKPGCIYNKDLDEEEGAEYFKKYNNYSEEEFWEAFRHFSHNEFELLVNIKEDLTIEQVAQTALP
tara:strand:- start:2579 stop:3115 length:537 start_codon:yes stop_codon:yes gene_type:complete